LLEIMAHGHTSAGHGLHSPAVRGLFSRDSVLASDWYAARLDAKQRSDQACSAHGVAALDDFLKRPGNAGVIARLDLAARHARAQAEQLRVRSAAYRSALVGTIGLQPLDSD
jgi:DNA-binding transcriptional MocR family regulator